MKKYITVAALLAAGTAFANATEISLAPSTISASLDADGIVPADVFAKELNAWFGSWEKPDLNGQVSAADGVLHLQLGNVASEGNGNYAAVKFDSDANLTSLSFTMTYVGAWGGGTRVRLPRHMQLLYMGSMLTEVQLQLVHGQNPSLVKMSRRRTLALSMI